MMSIGSAPPPPPPPQQSIKDQLDEQVAAGEITSEDEDAMLSALEAIKDDMAPDGPPAPGSEPPSQEEMQAKLEGLLSEQVEAGTLTQEQADELAGLFESGDIGPPPPPPGGGPEASGETDSESEDLIAKLLEELQEQTGYSESGDSTSTSASSLLVDYLA
jgi:hypothetical protein